MAEVKLSLRDKAQVIGITALLVAGLVVVALWELKPTTNPDDAPIVMAGGSFHVYAYGEGSSVDTHLTQDPNMKTKLVHSAKKKVYAVDVIQQSGRTSTTRVPNRGQHEIEFLFCDPSGCGGSNEDKVKIAFNHHNNANIEINSGYDWSDNGGVWDHNKTGWVLKKVSYPVWTSGAMPPTCVDRCTVILSSK